MNSSGGSGDACADFGRPWAPSGRPVPSRGQCSRGFFPPVPESLGRDGIGVWPPAGSSRRERDDPETAQWTLAPGRVCGFCGNHLASSGLGWKEGENTFRTIRGGGGSVVPGTLRNSASLCAGPV